MENAYDMKGLMEEMKVQGLELAEDAAGKAYKALTEWFKKSAAMSANPFDDMVIGFLPQIDAVVLPQIDKIDGHVG